MSAAKRFGTSILGVIVHTVAGLAAIASGIVLLALVAFVAPSMIGELGVDSLVSGGTLAENVRHLESDTFLSLPLLGLAFVVSLVTYVAGSRLGSMLHAIGTAEGHATGKGAPQGSGRRHADRSTAETYLWKLQRSNMWVGVLLIVFLGTALLLRALVQSGGTGPLSTIAGLVWFAVAVFGGPGFLAVATLAILGVWYGLGQSSREALVLGFVVWGLVALTGLGTLSRNGSGFGLVLAGMLEIYYGIRAWGATELVTSWGQDTFEELVQDPSRSDSSEGAEDVEAVSDEDTRDESVEERHPGDDAAPSSNSPP